MSEINKFFTQAQLALAAYGALQSNAQPDKVELRNIGMGRSQADDFSAQWHVVEQYNESHTVDIIDPDTGLVLGQRVVSNGLSVTLFEKLDTGEKTVAIRGTETSAPDFLTDLIDILILGTTKYQSQYASRRCPERS
jgi:hypothetical protein